MGCTFGELIVTFIQSITEGNVPNVEECDCPLDVYDPICASNNVVYTYSCYLKCAQKKNPSKLVFWNFSWDDKSYMCQTVNYNIALFPGIKGLCYGECPCCKRPYDDEDYNSVTNGGWSPLMTVPNYWRIPLKRQIAPSYTTATGQISPVIYWNIYFLIVKYSLSYYQNFCDNIVGS